MKLKTIPIQDFSKEDLECLGANNQLLDVREEEEYRLGHIKGAISVPLSTIEQTHPTEPKSYYIYCKSGNRSKQAGEFLADQGLDVVNLDGGYSSFSADDHKQVNEKSSVQSQRKKLNYSGMQCPGPIVNVNREIQLLNIGEQLEVTVTDVGFASDVQSWAQQTGHALVDLQHDETQVTAVIQKNEGKPQDPQISKNGTTIVLFSGDLDKALAAMIIANGARAAGKDVSIFFTFWGLNALKKRKKSQVRKTGMAKWFDKFLPKTPAHMPISKLNMLGIGNKMMQAMMRKKNVDSLPALIDQAIEQDVTLIACTMSMDVMGITQEELRPEIQLGGVGTYIGHTQHADHHLFI